MSIQLLHEWSNLQIFVYIVFDNWVIVQTILENCFSIEVVFVTIAGIIAE